MNLHKGAFNNYVDKMRGGGGSKMSVFVHAQGMKTVHAGEGGVKKWQNEKNMQIAKFGISHSKNYVEKKDPNHNLL